MLYQNNREREEENFCQLRGFFSKESSHIPDDPEMKKKIVSFNNVLKLHLARNIQRLVTQFENFLDTFSCHTLYHFSTFEEVLIFRQNFPEMVLKFQTQ